MPTVISDDNLTRAEAEARAAQLRDVAYDVRLRLSDDPGAQTFVSVTSITFHAIDDQPTFVDLAAERVESIELNGQPLDRRLIAGSRIELPALKRGPNRLRVVAECRYQHTGVGLHRVVDPVDSRVYVYTHFEPFDAHKVFACFDQPDLKARFTFHVTVPDSWTVISNYPREGDEPNDGGMHTARFATTPPISTYLAAIVAGDFHEVRDDHRGTPLGIFCRRSLARHLDPDEIFSVTKAGLDFFADYFDHPYPFAKYDQLLVPEFNMGAMENPGCVTFNEIFVFRSKVTESHRMRRANTILHEMAHMWFGDLVTMRWWDDLWLNESFATYMAHLAVEEVTRFGASWVEFAVAMKGWALRQDQLPSTHPISGPMPDTNSVRLNFDGITYAKGASVLRQLVAWVGDVPFRDGLRSYFRTHEWGNATLSDFLAALERASGRQLRPWSQEWLETAGASQLRAEFGVDGGAYSHFSLVQSAPPEYPTLRDHRVAVGLYDDQDGHLRFRREVELDVSGETTVVAGLDGEPAAALIIPNHRDLAFAKIRLDQNSVRAVIESDHGIDDALTRAICSAGLWDMTRDAEMSTADYIAFVAREARRETEVASLDRLLLQAVTAIDLYAHRPNRAHHRTVLAAAASGAFTAAEPGSDLQLVWARCRISTSDDATALDQFASWLHHDVVEGLRIDTDLRWTIIGRLAAAGRIGDDEIDAEIQRDPTDIGRRRAEAARAARPDASAKQAAWQRMTEPGRLPLQTLISAMAGFAQAGQDDLLLPYVAKYFAVLPTIWSERPVEEAEALVQGLAPHFLLGDNVLDGIDTALAATYLGTSGRRILTEMRDGVLRARRARAADAAAR